MAGDEPSRCTQAELAAARAGGYRVAAQPRAWRGAARDGDRGAGTGVHAVPLRGDEFQPGDAERVRSNFPRAQLQAVRREGGQNRIEEFRSEEMESLEVVGNGMAGIACLEQILKHSPKFRVTVFGDETHVNYNRILLSSVLAGERSPDDITINSLGWYQENAVGLRLGVRIVDVDSE